MTHVVHHPIVPAHCLRRGRSPGALERIDATFQHDQAFSNAEKIRLLRQSYFADVDALDQSGAVQLPE
jgi:hypothetical protein